MQKEGIIILKGKVDGEKSIKYYLTYEGGKIAEGKNISELRKQYKDWFTVNGRLKPNVLDEVASASRVLDLDGYATVRGTQKEFVARGWLENENELSLYIKTKATTLDGYGKQVMKSIFNYVNENYDNINSIRGKWRPEKGVTDNLDIFNDFIKKNTPLSKQH